MESIGERLKRLRHEAHLSQHDLARRVGIPQPNVSAYETGRRVPSRETVERLEVALAMPLPGRVAAARAEILAAAARRGLTDVRVFGSVARGEATTGSDLDLLVHPAETTSLFDLAAFQAEIEQLVAAPVDVVSDRGSGPTMSRILRDAVPV